MTPRPGPAQYTQDARSSGKRAGPGRGARSSVTLIATRRPGCQDADDGSRYGWSWPLPPAGSDPSLRPERPAPGGTGALRVAGVTNGRSDGGA
jgi:hypothetical protein